MFYRCPKCEKIWQYPVDKCPECFSVLERMKSEKIPASKGTCSPLGKVIGISEVIIPTIFHSKVPYFVLLLEDEQGNKWVQKSSQEYKIGDEFKTESSQDKNAVAIWRLKYDLLEGIEKVIDLVAPLEMQFLTGQGGLKVNQAKILLLPTLISPKHSYFADNTSPEFLQAAIKYLLESGAKAENIKVAGQSFDEIPIGASAQKSQLLAVCQEAGITPLDMAQTNFMKKENFEISEEVFSANLVINLPILKVGKSSASENLFKFLKKENYLGLKYLSSDEEIFQGLTKFLPPILTLAEAQNVQKRDKFVAYLGLVFGSFNSLNLDRVFAEVTMAELPEILKNVNIENIPILGRKVEELKYEPR